LSFWRSNSNLKPGELPRTFDALRVARVRALPAEVTRALSTLAVLGGGAPLAALSAVDAAVPTGLHQAVVAELVRFERQGQLEVCRLVDPRIARSLEHTVAASETLGIKLTAGALAAQALEELDPPLFSRVADVLVPLATPALEGAVASFWFEAWALTNPGRPDSVARLEQAAAGAQGIRRLVLLRKISEAKLFLGLPDEALALVQSAGRPGATPAQALPSSRVGSVLRYHQKDLLDQWDKLSADEAMAALELVRAEVLSNLVKKEDTQKAFGDLERRLGRLDGPAVHHLWVRWAKAWSWFLCEILGQAREAMRVCGVVRQRVPAAVLAADDDAIAFVRAEEIATAGSGDLTRAKKLTEEHIALAERSARLRDACLAWNARAIVHYGQGELALAKKAFEKAIELARTTGWLRREAISVHNLSLVLSELGDLDGAFARETLYARLSLIIGNHAAKAEAPAVLAGVELARGRLAEAEAYIATVRKVAEANAWDMLSAIARALSGRLRLQRFRASADSLELTRGRNDLLAALAVLEDQQVAWSEELDPAEVYGLLAVAMKFSGQGPNAKRLLENAAATLPADNVVSQQQLRVSTAWLAGENVDDALAWLTEAGFARRVALWRSLW
jgi:tetratricopeptide (TPR) repeat protein